MIEDELFVLISLPFPNDLRNRESGFQRVIIPEQPTIRLSRNNLVIEFIIPPLIEGSTCFKRHTPHHQEL